MAEKTVVDHVEAVEDQRRDKNGPVVGTMRLVDHDHIVMVWRTTLPAKTR